MYRVGGTKVSVADGGTNLASGTSGGILGYSATGVLASSVLLTAHALVIGSGAGGTPTPLASLGTTTTILHGNASGDPTFASVAIADLGSAITSLFASVVWGSAGSESGGNLIEVPATIHDMAGVTLANANTEITIVVSDGANDAEPSSTAVLQAAVSPVGVVLSGSGTATMTMRSSSGGLFTIGVLETTASSTRIAKHMCAQVHHQNQSVILKL